MTHDDDGRSSIFTRQCAIDLISVLGVVARWLPAHWTRPAARKTEVVDAAGSGSCLASRRTPTMTPRYRSWPRESVRHGVTTVPLETASLSTAHANVRCRLICSVYM